MLDYSLVENLLTPAPDDFMAHPADVRCYGNNEIVEGILKLNVGIGKPEILSMLEAYEEVIAGIVAEGGAVNTRLFNAHPSIAGVFNTAADTYDPARHRIKINLSAGIALREALAKVKTRKVQTAEVAPIILEVKDIVSGSVNDHLTAGSVVQITGSRLKFVAEDSTNGVFLIPAGGVEIRLDIYADNRPARIMAMLPATLSAGEYHLEVRTNYANGKNTRTQTIKVGRFHKILTAG